MVLIAYINEHWVFVESEAVSRGVTVTSHPVESGLDITDNVKRNPIAITLSGEIVGDNAAAVLSSITALHRNGEFVRYSGRNIISNAIIEAFDTEHPNTIYGGCAFSMTIKEVRVARSAQSTGDTATKQETKSGTQQVQSNTSSKTHTVKRGECLWSIAKAYYGNGAKYKDIYEANKDKIENPNLIYVGQVFKIP